MKKMNKILYPSAKAISLPLAFPASFLNSSIITLLLGVLLLTLLR